MSAVPAKFDVIDHFAITGRGVVVAGKIIGGTFRIGMVVPTRTSDMPYLTISAIEFIDPSISKRIHQEGLIFEERPSLQFIQETLPKGSALLAFENRSATPSK